MGRQYGNIEEQLGRQYGDIEVLCHFFEKPPNLKKTSFIHSKSVILREFSSSGVSGSNWLHVRFKRLRSPIWQYRSANGSPIWQYRRTVGSPIWRYRSALLLYLSINSSVWTTGINNLTLTPWCSWCFIDINYDSSITLCTVDGDGKWNAAASWLDLRGQDRRLSALLAESQVNEWSGFGRVG